MSNCKLNAPKDTPEFPGLHLFSCKKEYKTIVWELRYPNGFDKAINDAVKDGWIVTERTFVPAADNYTERKLIAFLERIVKED